MFNTIEVPILIPVAGIIVIIFFGFYLFKLNKNLEKLTKFFPIDNSEKIISNTQKKEEVIEENLIISPMVGIVYLAPSPDEKPYVKEGDHIKQGDTIALIEAMKTFNKVKAPRSAIVKKILVKSSAPVEYGEKLIIIE